MKSLIAILVVLGSLAAAGCGGKQVVRPDNAALPIRPYSDCLNAADLSTWFVASPSTLYASDNSNHFRIDMRGTCPRMGKTGSIRFDSVNHTGSDTRICGDSGDRVFTDVGMSCSIRSVTAISTAAFDAAQQEHASKN